MFDKEAYLITGYHNDEFYSNISTRPKKDGTVRVILNLKRFNDCMEKNPY